MAEAEMDLDYTDEDNRSSSKETVIKALKTGIPIALLSAAVGRTISSARSGKNKLKFLPVYKLWLSESLLRHCDTVVSRNQAEYLTNLSILLELMREGVFSKLEVKSQHFRDIGLPLWREILIQNWKEVKKVRNKYIQNFYESIPLSQKQKRGTDVYLLSNEKFNLLLSMVPLKTLHELETVLQHVSAHPVLPSTKSFCQTLKKLPRPNTDIVKNYRNQEHLLREISWLETQKGKKTMS